MLKMRADTELSLRLEKSHTSGGAAAAGPEDATAARVRTAQRRRDWKDDQIIQQSLAKVGPEWGAGVSYGRVVRERTGGQAVIAHRHDRGRSRACGDGVVINGALRTIGAALLWMLERGLGAWTWSADLERGLGARTW